MKIIAGFFGEFHFLSNFEISPFADRFGTKWASNEHYYQAHKTADADWKKRIQEAETPGKAKGLGRKAPMHKAFELTKEIIMVRGLRYKFQQNNALREKLLATGSSILIEENNWGDQYWGQCNGIGQNMLGKCLMIVRDEFAIYEIP